MGQLRALTIHCDGTYRGRACKKELICEPDMPTKKVIAGMMAMGWEHDGEEDFCPSCANKRARAAYATKSEGA
jgi:hypothetical protein